MVLTIDISNTSIDLAAMEAKGRVFAFSLAASERTADEYAALISLVAGGRGVKLNQAEGAILCSVVPRLTPVIRAAVRAVTGKPPLVVGPGVKTGLNIRIDDPAELGGDQVAAAVAALEACSLPCVTVEMSTATVLGVLDKTGSQIGCIITPGVMVSQNALASGASQLRHVVLEPPGRLIGKSSEESVKSGLLFGSAAMLDGLLSRIEETLSDTVSVVACGEWAKHVIPHCRREGILIDDDLIMRGLYSIYIKNRK